MPLSLLASLVLVAEPAPLPSWSKTTLDPTFRSEGVAIADVNKDGKPDVLVGEFWYEAPLWTRHEMQKPGDYGDGLKGYSEVFAVWADDFNADGYPDALILPHPGRAAYWLENPKGADVHWKRHEVWPSACNETPAYVDLLGTGQKVLLLAAQPAGMTNQGQMAYFTPDPKDPNAPWVMHPVSEPSAPDAEIPSTQRYSHGLGAGDINGDGRLDVIVPQGWWEQPPNAAEHRGPWKWHPAKLGAPCADMFALDVDGDGLNDVLSTSAHKYGIWWHKQRPAPHPGAGGPSFQTMELFPDLVSETHAAHLVDLDGDGLKDLVTGKRWWSHGKSEPGSDKPAALYWFKASKDADGMTAFAPHIIDADSGVGTQFCVADLDGDGRPDVATSNKKGVHIHIQKAGR